LSTRPEEPGAKTTVLTFQDKKERGERLSVLTAYDYPTARILDAIGIDAILVGDSLAMVVLGHETTLAVTMEEMLHHARAVARGARRALLVGDMPFLSFQADVAEAVRNGGRFLQAGMDAVKLEGGREYADTVSALVRAGIPVMGHVGLLPQSVPTIGIGAGPGTDGQVLVTHDILGLSERVPRFVRRYAEIGEDIGRAVRAYREDVEAGRFPGAEQTLGMPEDEWGAFLATLGPALARRGR
jgi:3-methyl-2-oxobutanoate hydroxymethyltransferase